MINIRKYNEKPDYNTAYTQKIDDLIDYVVFDLETTGLSPKYDEIIEIGAVKVRNKVIVDEYSCLIDIGKPLPSVIKRLTGITDNDLLNGTPFKTAISEFVQFIGTDFLVGHNVKFDINFINSAIGDNIENKYLDTMTLSRRIYKDWAHHRLIDLKRNFDIKVVGSHRALEDVKTTYLAFEILKSKYKELEIDTFILSKSIEKKLRKESQLNLSEFILDRTAYIYNRHIVFTGTLQSFKRKDAERICEIIGAFPQKSITLTTNILVVGDIDYKYSKDGKNSSKMIKAQKLIDQGQDLIIIPESDFLELITCKMEKN